MKPDDIVVCAFPGAHVTKSCPAVVLSTKVHHRYHPDIIIGLITRNCFKAGFGAD